MKRARSSGFFWIPSSLSGVKMSPGATALTRIPSGASSAASPVVKFFTAPLEVE